MLSPLIQYGLFARRRFLWRIRLIISTRCGFAAPDGQPFRFPTGRLDNPSRSCPQTPQRLVRRLFLKEGFNQVVISQGSVLPAHIYV
jgi:hypothetical protein